MDRPARLDKHAPGAGISGGVSGAPHGAPMIALDDVRLTLRSAGRDVNILRGVTLAVEPGETVAVVGPSGSGKSTLLHIAGLLEPPDSGDVAIAGQSCNGMNDDARTAMRREHLGFVYQNHHLLPEFSALENVAIPAIIDGLGLGEAKRRAREILGWMGLEERESHRPGKLSGGEAQRVAIARALASRPSLLLADEPTGNLDPATASDVFEVLLKLVRGAGLTALVATHNPNLAARMDRIVNLVDGRLVEA